ncbi:hypothetical protein BGX38DRAFT_1147302 [Terfezia claveryi]|nr:hypothetical protein BGX38DRAFT_1147302 [Terfezia claveryi]
MDNHHILRESRSTVSTSSRATYQPDYVKPKFLNQQDTSKPVNSPGLTSLSPLTPSCDLNDRSINPNFTHPRAVFPETPVYSHPEGYPHKQEGLKERFATIKGRVIDRHDINIEISKYLDPQGDVGFWKSRYRLKFPPDSQSYRARMSLLQTEFAARLQVEEVEPGPDGIKALRVTVIYPVASECPLPTEMSGLDREAVWDTFFCQMSLYRRASASTLGSGTVNANQPPTETREDGINISRGLRYWRGRRDVQSDQDITLSLLQQLHKLYDFFECDKHTTANRGLGYYSRVSKRPYDLEGGDWAPYFNPKSFKYFLVGRLFTTLYNFLAQLHGLQRSMKKGEIGLRAPIDAHWVSKMMLDACRAWDDLCWLEDCFSPTDVSKGKPYCLRPTINHPEASPSAAGAPGNWIRRLSESAPECTTHTEGSSECESKAKEGLLHIGIPRLEDPVSKVRLQSGPAASLKDDVNEHHEIEASSLSVKGEEKGTEGTTPKPINVSKIKDEQSVKQQNLAYPTFDIAKRHSSPECFGGPSDSMSGNNHAHAQSCNLNEKTQPKQGMKSINKDPEAQKCLDAMAKRIIAADKAKMDAFEASFKWASSNERTENPKPSSHSDYLDSVSSAVPSPSAGEPVSTYGPFESAGYAKLPSPCGSFENESYITRLCHNEDNSIHVDEKQNKTKLLSKAFKKGGAK